MRGNNPAKKDPREETLDRGRTLLAAWGLPESALPPVTPPEEFLERVGPFLGRDAGTDLVIAEWLGRIAHPAAAARLVEWEARAGKELRREIRRSLFRLEQKGIRAERPAEPRPARAVAPEPSEPEGYLGSIDGEGSRMAWLVRRGRGSMDVVLTVINDEKGMISVDGGAMPKARFQEAVKDLEATGPGAPVRVPWRYADAIMNAAFRKSPPRPGSMRADYLLSRAEVTLEESAAVPPCPILETLPAPEGSDEPVLEKSAELFKEKELRTWILPEEIARTHIQAFINATSSGIVVSKEAMTERMVGIMDAAMDDFLAGPAREIFARRLEEMAYVFHLRRRPEPAAMALAVARALRAPEERRMKNVSFLRGLVFRAFAPLFASRGGAPPEGAEAPGEASQLAEGSSRILDPSKVHETGVEGAGRVDDPGPAGPTRIIRP